MEGLRFEMDYFKALNFTAAVAKKPIYRRNSKRDFGFIFGTKTETQQNPTTWPHSFSPQSFIHKIKELD